MSAAIAQVPIPASLRNHDLESSALNAVGATNIPRLTNTSPLKSDQSTLQIFLTARATTQTSLSDQRQYPAPNFLRWMHPAAIERAPALTLRSMQ
jgi:hypothetical protein